MGGLTDIFNSALSMVLNFLALIVLTAALVGFALRTSRHAFFSLILSLYVGYALYAVFPFQLVGKGETLLIQAVVQIGLYLVLCILTYILMRRTGGSGSYTKLHILPLTLIAVLTAGFLLALGYHTFAINHVIVLSKSLSQFFAPNDFFFYWFVAPLIGLFFFAR